MAKHKSPSKIKYDKENPPVAVRLTRELRSVLDVIKGERTRSKTIQLILAGKLEPALVIKKSLEAKWAAERKIINMQDQRVLDELVRELKECRDQIDGE
jgi:hypothetical protein